MTQSRTLQRSGILLAIGLAVVLFVSVNLAGALGLRGVKADLTEASLYTLAPGTKAIIESLAEPVRLRLYQTRQLVNSVPALQSTAPQVQQMLRTFEEVGRGKVRVEFVDTLPFSAEEDQALGFRLAGFNLNRSGERGYFGLVGTNSLDGLETIDFLDPGRQAFLQYDLARMVYRLGRPTETRIGIIDGLSMFGSRTTGRRPWVMLNILADEFALTDLTGSSEPIPADVDVLLVAHPAQLKPAQLYAIDQYVLSGRPALVFVDPLAENSLPDVTNPMRPQNPSSDLAPLLASWGLTMDAAKVVGDRRMALETVGVAGQQRVVADYVPWLRVDGPAFVADEPITSRLEVMRLSSAGSLDPAADATTTFRPLLQTTEDSMLIARDDVMQRPNPNRLLDAFEPSGKHQVLAARVAGPARTAFPEGPPPAEGDQPPLPQPDEPAAPLAEGNINVIVVADSDLLADNHIVGQNGRLTTSNSDFVLNAVEDLAGGSALVDIRGGGIVSRPFTLVAEMEDRARAKYRETEERLTAELTQVQQQLAQLQVEGPQSGGTIILSAEQQQVIDQSYQRSAELRQQLREVRHALRADIEELDARLKFINIALVPGLLIIGTGLAAIVRNMRLRRYRQRRTGMQEQAS